jgi:hypothetical protein
MKEQIEKIGDREKRVVLELSNDLNRILHKYVDISPRQYASKEFSARYRDMGIDIDFVGITTDLLNAGYRKQSENVIELPCKVGDTAYCVYCGKVIQGIVRLIRPFVSEQEIIFKGNLICEIENLFIEDGTKEEVELYIVFEKPYGIERVAYLTREEAENALAKKKGGVE